MTRPLCPAAVRCSRSCCAAALLYAGCGAPAIDATDEHSMHASIEHVRAQLDTGQRAAFDTAMRDLDDMLFSSGDALSGATVDAIRPDALKRRILHGRTAPEIIRMVAQHRRAKK